MNRLNLGCGNDIKEGWVNVDNGGNPDIKADLEKQLPFKDNEFDLIYSNHVMEHINNFIPLMNEIHRISKPGAIIIINCPYFTSHGAYADPTHVRFFTSRSMKIFTKKNQVYSKKLFKVKKIKLRFTRENWIIDKPINFIVNKFLWIYEKFFCWILPMAEIRYALEVEK